MPSRSLPGPGRKQPQAVMGWWPRITRTRDLPETCPYCGEGIAPEDMDCPSQFLDRTAHQLATEGLKRRTK